MDDLDKMARELLAQWHLDRGLGEKVARDCRSGVIDIPEIYWDLIRAALLIAPPGYVLVPVEPTDTMVCQGGEYLHDTLRGMGVEFDDSPGELLQEIAEGCFNAMLAAAPEVK